MYAVATFGGEVGRQRRRMVVIICLVLFTFYSFLTLFACYRIHVQPEGKQNKEEKKKQRRGSEKRKDGHVISGFL